MVKKLKTTKAIDKPFKFRFNFIEFIGLLSLSTGAKKLTIIKLNVKLVQSM